MEIKKIKYEAKHEKVEIEWGSVQGPEGRDTVAHSLTSFDPPHPDFVVALDSIVPGVLSLLELFEEYSAGMTVRGITFASVSEDQEGAVVTCLKELVAVPSPLVLNTPLFPIGVRPGLDEKAFDRIRAEASRYIRGKRAQADLFPEDRQGGKEPGDDVQVTLTTERGTVTLSNKALRKAAREITA
jgi:hypothetical protein